MKNKPTNHTYTRRSALLLLAALSSALFGHATPALAAAPGNIRVGFHRVKTGVSTTYIRSNPGGFAVGTLFGPGRHGPVGDGFYVKQTHFHANSTGGGAWWAFGHAYGNAGTSAWIPASSLGAVEPNHPVPGGPPGLFI